jgi:hypothetical protein
MSAARRLIPSKLIRFKNRPYLGNRARMDAGGPFTNRLASPSHMTTFAPYEYIPFPSPYQLCSAPRCCYYSLEYALCRLETLRYQQAGVPSNPTMKQQLMWCP